METRGAHRSDLSGTQIVEDVLLPHTSFGVGDLYLEPIAALARSYKQLMDLADAMGIKYEHDGRYDTRYGELSRMWEYTHVVHWAEPRGVVLDAGCGYSLLPYFLATFLAVQQVFALDAHNPARDRYSNFRALKEAMPACEKVHEVDADICHLPTFVHGSVDVVYSVSVIEHIYDYRAALWGLTAAARPGCSLALTFDMYQDFIDYGHSAWPWCEKTRFISPQTVDQYIPGNCQLIAPQCFVDCTDWSDPPIHQYTFGSLIMKKLG